MSIHNENFNPQDKMQVKFSSTSTRELSTTSTQDTRMEPIVKESEEENPRKRTRE